MKIIADLHLHSKYSRAVSQKMNIVTISEWAKKKGINLVGTGDWTHPIWLRELRAQLSEAGEGIYKINSKVKAQNSKLEIREDPLFLLSTEISCIYSQGGKSHRIHILVFAPGFETVEKINKELLSRGLNLFSDGRPILGMSAKDLAEIILGIDDRCLIIPAHAWTPWFSLYGSKSGFDSIQECFGNFSKYIYAVETGLSSDPAMNWRIEELQNRSIVSFSDAHSAQKLGREATVFEIDDRGQRLELSYELIRQAITGLTSNGNPLKAKIAYTIEFYPEEGKYHYTGHRNCKVVYSPNDARKKGITCPVCRRPLTVGVMSRVEHLAKNEVELKTEKDEFGVRWIKERKTLRAGDSPSRRPYVMLVPLMEIIAEVLNQGTGTKGVEDLYDKLINNFAGEFNVLLNTELEEIEKTCGKRMAEGIAKVRSGDIVIEPGYDGVFGKVGIWPSFAKTLDDRKEDSIDQRTLF